MLGRSMCVRLPGGTVYDRYMGPTCALVEGVRTMFLFFFQAEDGIRDLTVTGVQTCALPISHSPSPRRAVPPNRGSAPARCCAARADTIESAPPSPGRTWTSCARIQDRPSLAA